MNFFTIGRKTEWSGPIRIIISFLQMAQFFSGGDKLSFVSWIKNISDRKFSKSPPKALATFSYDILKINDVCKIPIDIFAVILFFCLSFFWYHFTSGSDLVCILNSFLSPSDSWLAGRSACQLIDPSVSSYYSIPTLPQCPRSPSHDKISPITQ